MQIIPESQFHIQATSEKQKTKCSVGLFSDTNVTSVDMREIIATCFMTTSPFYIAMKFGDSDIRYISIASLQQILNRAEHMRVMIEHGENPFKFW